MSLLDRLLRRNRTAPEPDPVAELHDLMDGIVDDHNALYHPGFRCAENGRGECVDLFGGVRVAGPLGEYEALR